MRLLSSGPAILRRMTMDMLDNEIYRSLELLDGVNAAIYIADPATYELLYTNDVCRRLLGATDDKKCHKALMNLDAPCPFCTNDIIFKEGFVSPHVWEWRDEKTGRWHRCSDKPVTWIDGRKARFEIAIDITEYKEMEAAVRENEFWMRESQRVARVGSYILDVASGRWSCSEVMKDIFGIDESFDKTVEGWVNIVHPEDRRALLDYFQNEVIAKGKQFNRTYRISRISDGAVRWVFGQGEVLLDESGTPAQMLGCIRDITEWKTAESEKETLRKQLALSQKMDALGRLAGGVAHDFNNLLGVIMGSAELAMDDLDPFSDSYKELEVLMDTALKSRDLSMKLLTFARDEKLNAKQISPYSLIDELGIMLERSINNAVSIKIEAADGLNDIVVDKNQMLQALLNICNNAADAMPQGGTLTISIAAAEGSDYITEIPSADNSILYCSISISDTGSGIKKEHLDKIFDPFFTTKPMGKGTGLGLSIAHGVLKNHNGALTVKSERGSGSTIIASIPFAPQSAADDNKQTRPSVAREGKATILLVDDEETLTRINKKQLTRKGYDVECANSGAEAIRIFRDKHKEIDVVALDYVMPEMSAIDVFHEMKEIDPDVKVIIASGFSEKGGVSKILEMGAMAFIQKPFGIDELCVSIRDVLDA